MAAVSFSSTTSTSSIHDFGHPLKKEEIHSTISPSSIPKHDLFENCSLSILQFSFLSEKRRALVSRVSQRFNFISKVSEKRSTIFRLDNFILRAFHHFISSHIGTPLEELPKKFLDQLNLKFSEEIISRNSFFEEINLYTKCLRSRKYSFLTNFALFDIIDPFARKSLESIINFAEKEKTKENPKSFQKLRKLAFDTPICGNPKTFEKSSISLAPIQKDTFPVLQTIRIDRARKSEIASLLSSNRDSNLELIVHRPYGEEDEEDNDNSPLTKVDPAPLISVINPRNPNFFEWFNNFSLRKIVYEEGFTMDNHTIFENSPGLQELSFSSLLPGEFYPDQSKIDKVFKSFQNLTSLSLLDMESWSPDSLCTRIANLTNLKSLSLSFSRSISIFVDGKYKRLRREESIAGSIIAKALVPSLTYLYLDFKGIDTSHQLIARIRSLSSLTTLILTDNKRPLLNFTPMPGEISAPFEALTFIGENSSIRHLEFRNIFCLNSDIVFSSQINNLVTFCDKIFKTIPFKGCIKIVEDGLDDPSHAVLAHTFSNYSKVNIIDGRRKMIPLSFVRK